MKIFIRYGQERRSFDPPTDWNILSCAAFKDHLPDKDAGQLTRDILAKPIGSDPLQDRLNPSDRVAILIEDLTRMSPKRAVLRVLLDVLEKTRIPKENISLVVALGTHRELSHEELKAVYGEEAVRDYHFTNHDCHATDLVPVGRLRTGTTVKINRTVYEATFKIGIGSIFPHPLNGFGGGSKILFPGVADFDSTLEHHLQYGFRRGSELGNTKGNPFYDEVCDLARSGGLDFIINSVMDHNDRVFDVVCGDPIKSHLAGVDICKGIISQPFHKKADLTVISSFPYSEGPQIMKPLAPASVITKEGGTIILVTRMTTPLPDLVLTGCERFRRRHSGRLRASLFEIFDQNQSIIEGSPPELNMCMSQVLLAQNDFRVILVSEDMGRREVERLGFLFAEDLDKAFAMAAELDRGRDVHVVPAGGVILPLLENA